MEEMCIRDRATSKVARSHFNESEAKEFEKAAHAFVSKWITQLRHNTYNVYFNGESYREGTIAVSYTHLYYGA